MFAFQKKHKNVENYSRYGAHWRLISHRTPGSTLLEYVSGPWSVVHCIWGEKGMLLNMFNNLTEGILIQASQRHPRLSAFQRPRFSMSTLRA